MDSHDRIYLDMLRRVRAAPGTHIGGRSLLRLRAFHFGYSWFRPDLESELFPGREFRDWIAERYHFPTQAMSAGEMLGDLAESDEHAFELFFQELESFMTAYPASFERKPARFLNKELVPVSAWLDMLVERPAMYLPRESADCLRAHLDDYALASLEVGHPECADLQGFDLWLRAEMDLKGYFRWDSIFVKRCRGDEKLACRCAIESLRAYRATTRGSPQLWISIYRSGKPIVAFLGVDN